MSGRKALRGASWLWGVALSTAGGVALAQDHAPTCRVPNKPPLDASSLCAVAEAVKPKLAHRAYIGPEEVRQYDVNTLARLLVERLHEECDLPRGNSDPKEIIDDKSEVIMMVKNQVIEANGENGFLNQHVTGSTGGCACSTVRFEAEQALSLMRLPYSERGRALLPKYAAFNVRRSDYGHFDLPTNYGDVALVFKDTVKSRTTWTYTDSLALPSWPKDAIGFPARTTGYARNKDRAPTAAPAGMWSFVSGEQCTVYCEAQIWGEIDLSDVKYAMIPVGTPVPESLKKAGVPVYSYSHDPSVSGAVQYKLGSLLASGNEKKVSKPKNIELEKISSGLKKAGVNPVEKNILRSKELGKLPDSELLNRLQESKGDATLGYNVSYEHALVAELATRAKSPKIIQALTQRLTSLNEQIRSQAYYGLSELPWDTYRPILLRCFSDLAPYVKMECAGLAADHLKTDPELAEAVHKLVTDPNPPVSDWAMRLEAPTLCDPSVYAKPAVSVPTGAPPVAPASGPAPEPSKTPSVAPPSAPMPALRDG